MNRLSTKTADSGGCASSTTEQPAMSLSAVIITVQCAKHCLIAPKIATLLCRYAATMTGSSYKVATASTNQATRIKPVLRAKRLEHRDWVWLNNAGQCSQKSRSCKLMKSARVPCNLTSFYSIIRFCLLSRFTEHLRTKHVKNSQRESHLISLIFS